MNNSDILLFLERKNTMSVLKGNAYWASITSPNTTFDSDGVWTIDVGNLDTKNKKMAQEDGLNVKNKGDDRGDFVTIKRKVKNKRGDLNKAPEVVDAQKRAMINTLIGQDRLVTMDEPGTTRDTIDIDLEFKG